MSCVYCLAVHILFWLLGSLTKLSIMSVEDNVLARKNKNSRKPQILKLREEERHVKSLNTKSNQGNVPENECTVSAGNNKRKADENNPEGVRRKKKKLKSNLTNEVKNGYEDKSVDGSLDIPGVEKKNKKKKEKELSDVREYTDSAGDGGGSIHLEHTTITRDNGISQCMEKKKKKKKKKKELCDLMENTKSAEDGCGSLHLEQATLNGVNDISSVEKKKKKELHNVKEYTDSADAGGSRTNLEQAFLTRGNEISRPLLGTLVLELKKDPSFSTLKGRVCSNTLQAIQEMGFTKLTAVQSKVIPPLLEGKDLVASAKTGSGKTLAFLIPAIEIIYKHKLKPANGVGCIIISPTRELSVQTYKVLKQLMTYHDQTHGLLMGGTDRTTEAKYLSKGINIIVATPGRLLDHLQNTSNFLYNNLQCLVIDEADQILKIGFEEDLKRIINLLPKTRQTMLFSATNNAKTEALTRLALKKEPVYIGVDDKTEQATVDGLNQAYLTCPSDIRFLVLYTFLKKNGEKNKLMIFCSSCSSVRFHKTLLKCLGIDCLCIHGRQTQSDRTTAFLEFSGSSKGILLCTDVVARGLDFPSVDWIVQYDPPDDPKEYIHRVGRTARGQGGSGCALLFLRPEELGFIRYLSEARVPLIEFECTTELFNIQQQMEMVISKNDHLKDLANSAFKDYLRAYNCHQQKIIFDVNSLDLAMVAKSFGLTESPIVALHELKIKTPGIRKMKKKQNRNERRYRQRAAQQSFQHH